MDIHSRQVLYKKENNKKFYKICTSIYLSFSIYFLTHSRMNCFSVEVTFSLYMN